MVIPWTGCFRNLKRADHTLRNDPEVKKTVESLIGFKFTEGLEVRALLDVVVRDVGMERIAKRVTYPLRGLKIVSYYGCALARPPRITHLDDPENPQCLDKLIETLRTIPLDWPYKTECCGADLAFTRADIVKRIVGEIMAGAREAGAEAIVTPCGLCHFNLEVREPSTTDSIPVFYFTELMGLAFGSEKCSQWWEKHFIKPSELLEEKGLAVGAR